MEVLGTIGLRLEGYVAFGGTVDTNGRLTLNGGGAASGGFALRKATSQSTWWNDMKAFVAVHILGGSDKLTSNTGLTVSRKLEGTVAVMRSKAGEFASQMSLIKSSLALGAAPTDMTTWHTLTIDNVAYKVQLGALARSMAVNARFADIMDQLREPFEVTPSSRGVQPSGEILFDVEARLPASVALGVELYRVDDAGTLRIMSVEQLYAARTDAVTAALDYEEKVAGFAAHLRAGGASTDFADYSELFVRPAATLDSKLSPEERQHFDEWWKTWQSAMLPTKPNYKDVQNLRRYEKYASATDNPISFEDWLGGVGSSIEDVSQYLPTEPRDKETWTDDLWGALKDFGGGAVDLAKDWGPVGTIGAVAAGSDIVKGETNYLPWLIGGVVAIAVLSD